MKSPLLFQDQPAIEISDPENKVIVCPDHGARILRWRHAGREVITWPGNTDWRQVAFVRGGNPVLFPFVSRHFVDGKAGLWGDDKGVVRRMPMHGFAQNAKFAVIDDDSDCTLRMRLVDSEQTRVFYPFSFHFDVVVSLLPQSRLEIRFETTNTGAQSMPYYAGHHFYFAVPHEQRGEWTLQLPCAEWERWSAAGPAPRESATQALIPLDDPLLSDRIQIRPSSPEVTLQNTRTGQKLVLALDHPNSTPWRAVTTWTETPTSDFYCVEPWLGMPDAIHNGEGLRQVAPGQTESAICIIDASDW